MKAIKILVCVVVMSLFIAQSAFSMHLPIEFGGYVRSRVIAEMLTTEGAAEDGGDLEETVFTGEGEALLSVASSAMTGSDLDVMAKVELLVENGGVAVDDTWVEVSKGTTAFKMGRFEAEGIYAAGEDFYIPEAPGAPAKYEVNKARGRENIGAAVTMDMSDNMMFQVNAVYAGVDSNNKFGVRPVVKFSSDTFTVKGGGEYAMEMPQDNDAESESSVYGFGANAEFGLGAITLGATGTYGVEGGKDDAGDDLNDATTLTTFGYLKMGVGETGLLGIGGGWTQYEIDDVDGEDSRFEVYASYQIKPLLGEEDLRLQLGAGFSQATLEIAGDQENTSFGVATRLRYDWGGFTRTEEQEVEP